MEINLKKINFTFKNKPLLIGGKAMEYYGLRKSGNDIDFVVSKFDFERLVKKYPQQLKNLCGDFGVVVYEFEIWKTIDYFDYNYLSQLAIEKKDYLVISLEKLLFLKSLASKIKKYHDDMNLIISKINSLQGNKYKAIKRENEKIIKDLKNIKYIKNIDKF